MGGDEVLFRVPPNLPVVWNFWHAFGGAPQGGGFPTWEGGGNMQGPRGVCQVGYIAGLGCLERVVVPDVVLHLPGWAWAIRHAYGVARQGGSLLPREGLGDV